MALKEGDYPILEPMGMSKYHVIGTSIMEACNNSVRDMYERAWYWN